MAEFPQEILFNILTRLPVKPLGQFKCVSKSWRSLISDPYFARSQLKQAISNPTNNSITRILTREPFYSLDYESPASFADSVDNDDEEAALVALDYPVREPIDGLWIMGSCDGLICIHYYPDSIILWNPCTKESRELPKPPLSISDLDSAAPYGFGFDSANDVYKVAIGTPGTSSSNKTWVQIFDVKTGHWRTIEGVDQHVKIRDDTTGIFLNGAVHWLVFGGSDLRNCNLIICLDLVSEKFGEMSIPNGEEIHLYCFGTLNILGRCLALLYFTGDDTEIWEMKEYGRISSWMKTIVLRTDDFEPCEHMTPVCYTKNGEVVIDIGGTNLLRYNVQENTSRELKNNIDEDLYWTTYVQSLVSPHDHEEEATLVHV